MILPAWVDITTRLLQGPTADSSSWFVMDNAIDDTPLLSSCFATSLQEELKTNGILDSLKAARTNGEIINKNYSNDDQHGSSHNDVDLTNMIMAMLPSAVSPPPSLLHHHTDTNASSSSSSWSSSIRGDRSAFVGRNARQRSDFAVTFPHLQLLIQKIERTAHHYLGNNNNNNKGDNDQSCHLDFDFDLTSVQVACFPGDGTSHYPRHCDRKGSQCREEKPSSSSSSSMALPIPTTTARLPKTKKNAY